MKSSLEIARAASLRPVADIAAELGLQPDEYELYGPHKAKIRPNALERLAERPDGREIVVTAITPTPLGEGPGPPMPPELASAGLPADGACGHT